MSEQPNPTPEPDPVDQTDDVAALRSEAASRRRALRAVEAERDQLAEWKESRQREDVHRMAAERFADPSDLWAVTSLDAMRSEDGEIDMERARGELDRVLGEKPHWAKAAPPPPPPPNLHPGARATVEPEGPSFGQSIKRALRGG